MDGLGIFDQGQQRITPQDEDFARAYLTMMHARTRLHTSAAVHKKWALVFCRLRAQFTVAEIATVIDLIDRHMPRVNYTIPNHFFEQFGPLLMRCRTDFPDAFIVLPTLPQGGAWATWAAGFQWPNPTDYDTTVKALRTQLWHFQNVCEQNNLNRVGWPVAAAWFDHRREEWHGWNGCPPMIRTLWTAPHPKHDAIINNIISPTMRKPFLYGNPNR